MMNLIERIKTENPDDPIVHACFYNWLNGMSEWDCIATMVQALVSARNSLIDAHLDHIQKCGYIEPIKLDTTSWPPEKIRKFIEEWNRIKEKTITQGLHNE
jgi:hypothetical protein